MKLRHYSFLRRWGRRLGTTMKRLLGAAALVSIALLPVPPAYAAESQSFWDLKPEQLRQLVAAPQIMVTRTAAGLDAYCRCPAALVILGGRGAPKLSEPSELEGRL